jgi:Ser/Thr protein kinase RdoA (MazF antagonist)
MAVSLESIPAFQESEALAAAERHYGIVGRATPLPSERDQNFLITDARGGKFVLKIANAQDAPELLEFQNQAMRRVVAAVPDCRVPQVMTSRQGLDVAHLRNSRTGSDHCVRVLSFIDGQVLAQIASRTPALFESIGAAMAKVAAALQGYAHPAMNRVLQWDLRRAGMAREHAGLLTPDRRARVERHFLQWEAIDWTILRHGVIHGDANDHNVIVDGGRMTGLLDFGDMVYTATVCDLAVTLAYAMLDEKEPLSAAAHVIQAYQRHYPLTETEQRVLFALILTRLSMSVCYSAHNRVRNPRDPYQVVTEAAAWNLLDVLERSSAQELALRTHPVRIQ